MDAGTSFHGARGQRAGRVGIRPPRPLRRLIDQYREVTMIKASALAAVTVALLLGTADARFSEPSDDMESDCQEALEEALEEYQEAVQTCLNEASTLKEAKNCWNP
jgi:hypothetical protein